MISLVCAIAACVAIHAGAAAWAATHLGVRVREVSFGVGPVLKRFGMLTIRLLPVGGFVKFKDSRTEYIAPTDMRDAFDAQPLAVRLTIGASGCAALLLMVTATAQFEGLRAFASGFGQFFSGGLSPLGDAQELLEDAQAVSRTLSFATLLGFAAAKFAAFNLLPFPACNGGFMLAEPFRKTALARQWPAGLTTGFSLLQIALSFSWMFALAAYVTGSGAAFGRLIAQ
jgi:hypothetical protein